MSRELVRAARADLDAVRRFYAQVGYPGGVTEADTVFVLRDEGALVGAVRLSSEEDETVLRGLYVDPTCQRQGLGSSLLDAAVAALGGATCWCVPYAHLRSFYSRSGFVAVPAGELPGFLVARAAAYRKAGSDVLVLRRPAEARGRGRR